VELHGAFTHLTGRIPALLLQSDALKPSISINSALVIHHAWSSGDP
jgi:hypothetical protein